MKLAIIGAGAMGKWFAKFGKDRDWDISITDVKKEKAKKIAENLDLEFSESNEKAAEGADVVLIAVPIKETPKVIGEVADFLDKGSLLVDIASVKKDTVEKMKEIKTDSELVSLHPLFGPGTNRLDDKDIISIPVQAGKKYQELKKILSDFGAQVVEMEAKEHDRLMAITQSLTHFTLLTYISTLNSMKDFEKAKSLQTPMSQKLFDLSKAFLSENPELCGEIQIQNKYSSIARSSVLEACRSLNVALKAENTNVIEEIFEEIQEKLSTEEIEKSCKKLHKETEGN